MLNVPPSGPVAAEDIRHLERKPSHGFSLERLQGLDGCGLNFMTA
jgi:hypothetical protein